MTEEVLQLLSDDPMVVLNRGYRAKERIAAMASSILDVVKLPDPVGRILSETRRPNGLVITKVSVPLVAIMTLQEEIKDEIMEIADFERQTSQIIKELVEDLNFKTVLELRYLSYLRWEEIAVRMNYTFRWTQELHHRALLALQEAASALIPA